MRSMTGCGYGRAQRDGWEVTAELKTVNHRFLDIGMRLPRNIAFLEQTVREEIGKSLKRGHVDAYITVRNTESSETGVTVDRDLARQYFDAAAKLAEEIGVENDLTAGKLLGMEGVTVLTEREMDQGLIGGICREALDTAISQLVAMREKEGFHLKADLALHLKSAEALKEKIAGRAPMIVSEYREKLTARLLKPLCNGSWPCEICWARQMNI